MRQVGKKIFPGLPRWLDRRSALNRKWKTPKKRGCGSISDSRNCSFSAFGRANLCHKSTVMFTEINAAPNCFPIKPLHPVRKYGQMRNVDFLKHAVLTHIRVAFRKVETKHKAYTSGWPDWLFYGASGEIGQKVSFWAFGYEFCSLYNQEASESF